MTKQDLTLRIADKTGVTIDVVKLIIDEYAEGVINCLSSGEDYFQRGFGTFQVRMSKPKVGHDIMRGIRVEIPSALKPKFIPSKFFVARVKGEVK